MNENKKTEERTCENCLYYLKYDKECINYNPYSSYKVNPPEMKNCLFWESKEKGSDNIPF